MRRLSSGSMWSSNSNFWSLSEITATGSGLFMALMNILPTWIVNAGRDLILLLAGGPERSGG